MLEWLLIKVLTLQTFLEQGSILVFFSKSSTGQVCQMTYLPWQKFTRPFNMEEWQQNIMEMAKLHVLLYYFHATSLPVHHVHSGGCQQTQKIKSRCKWKPIESLFDCHEGWKGRFCSSCSYLACCSKVLTLLNNISWSKQLIHSHHVFLQMQMIVVQSISSWQNEPAMIMAQNTTSSQMADQKGDFKLQKKAASLSLFSKSCKWLTTGQSAGNS